MERKLLAQDGIIVADNILAHGQTVENNAGNAKDSASLRKFNDHIAEVPHPTPFHHMLIPGWPRRRLRPPDVRRSCSDQMATEYVSPPTRPIAPLHQRFHHKRDSSTKYPSQFLWFTQSTISLTQFTWSFANRNPVLSRPPTFRRRRNSREGRVFLRI